MPSSDPVARADPWRLRLARALLRPECRAARLTESRPADDAVVLELLAPDGRLVIWFSSEGDSWAIVQKSDAGAYSDSGRLATLDLDAALRLLYAGERPRFKAVLVPAPEHLIEPVLRPAPDNLPKSPSSNDD